jgi:hypothetical protein
MSAPASKAVLDRVAELHVDLDAIWRAIGDGLQRRFVPRFAGAEENELRVEREVVRIAEDEVEPFLRHEPSAHGDDRHFVGGPESHLALQRFAAFELSGERVD